MRLHPLLLLCKDCMPLGMYNNNTCSRNPIGDRQTRGMESESHCQTDDLNSFCTITSQIIFNRTLTKFLLFIAFLIVCHPTQTLLELFKTRDFFSPQVYLAVQTKLCERSTSHTFLLYTSDHATSRRAEGAEMGET